jgi:hypothetical protein
MPDFRGASWKRRVSYFTLRRLSKKSANVGGEKKPRLSGWVLEGGAGPASFITGLVSWDANRSLSSCHIRQAHQGATGLLRVHVVRLGMTTAFGAPPPSLLPAAIEPVKSGRIQRHLYFNGDNRWLFPGRDYVQRHLYGYAFGARRHILRNW